MRSSPLAALIVCAACSENGDSTATPTDESDTDTDTDSDTDTDVDAWDGNAVVVNAFFAYDAEQDAIVQSTMEGAPVENEVQISVVDLDDWQSSPQPTKFCFFDWAIPDGAIAENESFGDEYWLSFDLSDAAITYTGEEEASNRVGDCEHLRSFMGEPRGDRTLTEFAAGWGIGFGMKPMTEVDDYVVEDWAAHFETSHPGYGTWESQYPNFAAGALTRSRGDPEDADLIVALEVDPETWEVRYDATTESATALELATQTSPPSALYVTMVMYYFD